MAPGPRPRISGKTHTWAPIVPASSERLTLVSGATEKELLGHAYPILKEGATPAQQLCGCNDTVWEGSNTDSLQRRVLLLACYIGERVWTRQINTAHVAPLTSAKEVALNSSEK